MPSTTSVTIIMVANTGRRIEISERNMEEPGNWELGTGNREPSYFRSLGVLRWRSPPVPGSPFPVPVLTWPFTSACNRHLHPGTQRADVADDNAVAGVEPVRVLGNRLAFIHDADADGRALQRIGGVEAVDERLVVSLCLAERLRGDDDRA